MCPQGSSGTRCKVLSRTFSGAGWAWVRRLPPCLPVTASLRVLTRRPSGLLLYSGPLAPHPRRPNAQPTPMLVLELQEGRPQLLVEGGDKPLKLRVNTTIHDGNWHTIHLHLHSKVRLRLTPPCIHWADGNDATDIYTPSHTAVHHQFHYSDCTTSQTSMTCKNTGFIINSFAFVPFLRVALPCGAAKLKVVCAGGRAAGGPVWPRLGGPPRG